MQKLMKQKKRLVVMWSLMLCLAWIPLALYAQDQPVKPKMGEPSKLKISGWAQVQYQSVWQDGKAVTESFRIRRARLSADGQLHPMLTYKLQADFGNSPALVDAYLKLRFCDAFSLQAGQFKTPFTIESGISPMNLEYIDYGEPIQKLAGYSDICGIGRQGRDIGLMAIGRLFAVDGREKPFHLLHYSLGVFNGNGINNTDANLHKDVVGKLDFHPWLPELTLSDVMLKQVGSIVGSDIGVMNPVHHGSNGTAITAYHHRILKNTQVTCILPGNGQHICIDETDIALMIAPHTFLDDMMKDLSVKLYINIKNMHVLYLFVTIKRSSLGMFNPHDLSHERIYWKDTVQIGDYSFNGIRLFR